MCSVHSEQPLKIEYRHRLLYVVTAEPDNPLVLKREGERARLIVGIDPCN